MIASIAKGVHGGLLASQLADGASGISGATWRWLAAPEDIPRGWQQGLHVVSGDTRIIDRELRLPIYVVHYNAPDWLAETVASLQASVNVEVDLTVIDNGSRRPPLHLPDHVKVERLERNVGFAGAANRALDLVDEGPYFGLTSHDVQVAPDALARALEFAEAHPQHGIVGLEGGGWNDLEGGWISGTFMLLRKACSDDVGRFDELFGSYVEDVDYCHRAARAGWRVGIASGAHASEHGSSDSRRAAMLMRVNWIVLHAKERNWSAFSRHLAGALRRAVTQPGREWLAVLGLSTWRLLRLMARQRSA